MQLTSLGEMNQRCPLPISVASVHVIQDSHEIDVGHTILERNLSIEICKCVLYQNARKMRRAERCSLPKT